MPWDTSFNTIPTLAARLQYFSAVSGNRLSCMPLELKLRGKSTTMSHRSAIFYVDLVVRSGMALEAGIKIAEEREEARRAAGLDQAALDEAARQGFANGAFEDLAEDVPAIAEELFSIETPADSSGTEAPPTSTPRGRLESKLRNTESV